MAGVNASDDEWCPPTEEESKVLQSRRERQDKISKLLGEYLLKGYKMLGTSCSSCDTILMRSRQGMDYCVACNDVKDTPAVSSSAARCLTREIQMRQLNGASDGDIRSPVQSPSSLMPSSNIARLQEYCQPSRECTQLQPRPSAGLMPAESKVIVEALSAVNERLSWATDELRRSTSIETCCQLCMLIRSCSDAMQSLKRLV